MRVLISGFEPFGGRDLNPTSLIITALENQQVIIPEGLIVDQVLLPVVFEHSFEALEKRIKIFNPDIVLALGMAAKRDSIELETLAVNKIDADIQDNAGAIPKDQKINLQGPESYPSTLPLLGIFKALQDAHLPVKMSNSAGTYVCNYVFYRLMETNVESLRLCGFIHVPQLPEQAEAEQPRMAFEDLKKAVEVILKYVQY